MANLLFDPGREGFLRGEIDWDTATIKASICRNYTFDAADKFLSDATATASLVATTTLTTKTWTNGVAGCDIMDFSTIATGANLTSILVYQSSAVAGGADVADTAKRLIAYIDTLAGSVTMNVAPNGSTVTFAPSTGASKLFKL